MNPHNFTTLLIPGPNGSQPQMIKVVGNTKIPIQLATSTGASIPTIRRVIKTGGPLVVPVNNIQLKQQQTSVDGEVVTASINNGHQTIICNPGGASTNTVSFNLSSNQTSKAIASSITASPLLQTQIKHIANPKIQNISDEHSEGFKPINTKVQTLHPICDNQLTSTICGSPPKSLMNTSILDHSGIRKRHDFEFDYSIENKRRKSEKGGKGLRHFSMKVCEKVKAKGTTSYNEVADELVHEFTDSNPSNQLTEAASYDQKNIRRRVYDALNVLMAMNIISKEKKEIKWLGLPTNSAQECSKLEQERKTIMQNIKIKTQQLQDLILQQIAFKNLVERNRKREDENGEPQLTAALQLPFIIVNTDQDTTIDCSISNAKEEYLFNFDNTFEIHDDIEVLKRMGMSLGLDKGKCTPQNLELAKKIIPKDLEAYVVELAKQTPEDNSAKNKFPCLDIHTDNSCDSMSSISHKNGRSPSYFDDFEESDID